MGFRGYSKRRSFAHTPFSYPFSFPNEIPSDPSRGPSSSLTHTSEHFLNYTHTSSQVLQPSTSSSSSSTASCQDLQLKAFRTSTLLRPGRVRDSCTSGNGPPTPTLSHTQPGNCDLLQVCVCGYGRDVSMEGLGTTAAAAAWVMVGAYSLFVLCLAVLGAV